MGMSFTVITLDRIVMTLRDYLVWLILALGSFLFFVGFYRTIEEPYFFDVYLTNLDGLWISALGFLIVMLLFTKQLPKE